MLQLPQPGPLRARVGARRTAVGEPAVTGGKGRTQACRSEPAQNADEGHQVAARAGAAGEIVIARLESGASSRGWRTPPSPRRYSSATPVRAPTECAGRGNRGTRRPARSRAAAGAGGAGRAAAKQQQESGQALQNCLPFRCGNLRSAACGSPCTSRKDASGRARRYARPACGGTRACRAPTVESWGCRRPGRAHWWWRSAAFRLSQR